MQLPILFESLDRIPGREGRSKLLQSDSSLYQIIHQLKQKISEQYVVGADRMDLHIKLTDERRDPNFRSKAESLHGQSIDLNKPENNGYDPNYLL